MRVTHGTNETSTLDLNNNFNSQHYLLPKAKGVNSFFCMKLKMITVSVFKEGQQHAFTLKIVSLM